MPGRPETVMITRGLERRSSKKLLRLAHAFLLVYGICAAVTPAVASNQQQVIISEATYTMGDGETPASAEAMVLQKAKQIALEQAGTYVESYTKATNLDLTQDEIQTIAGGVIRVEVLEKSRTLAGDGVQFFIKIKATVTTDQMEDLARRIKGRNVADEYTRFQAEYVRVNQELEQWKKEASFARDSTKREAALEAIREKEKAFASIQRSERDLFRRVVSGELLLAESENEEKVVDELVEKILNQGFRTEIGKISVRKLPKDNHDFVKDTEVRARLDKIEMFEVSVPLLLEISPQLSTMLSETAVRLGGKPFTFPKDRSAEMMDGAWPQHCVSLLTRHSVTDERGVALRALQEHSPYAKSPCVDVEYEVVMGLSDSYFEVKLAKNPYLNNRFAERVKKLALSVELEFEDARQTHLACKLPNFLQRLIAGHSHSPRSVVVDKGSPDSVWVTQRPLNFRVNQSVLNGKALSQVSVRFVEVDQTPGPAEICLVRLQRY